MKKELIASEESSQVDSEESSHNNNNNEVLAHIKCAWYTRIIEPTAIVLGTTTMQIKLYPVVETALLERGAWCPERGFLIQ